VLIVINHGIDKEKKMSDNIKTSKHFGIDTVDTLIELKDMIAKVVPDIVFKSGDINKWGLDKDKYPDGICMGFQVFHITDTNNAIGSIDVNCYNDKPKYGISSLNITSGRNSYGIHGQHKYSIHPKNIVREAKKAFKPFTFDQIADRHRHDFVSKINSISNTMNWELRSNICDGYEHFIDDLENLHHMGYTSKNEKFATMMDYVIQNKEKIDKYKHYNPIHYFVLVKDGEVHYRLNLAKNEPPIKLPSKEALPDDIKGKLFVLDITDKQDFVEDIGFKENDGAYWIIA
jgi:hypothetical protein